VNVRFQNVALVGALLLGLLFVLELIIHRSFGGAIRGLRSAFKAEMKTDCGRVNFIFIMALLFLFLVTHLSQLLTNALTDQNAPKAELQPAIVMLYCGLLFLGSVVVVGYLESRAPVGSAARQAKAKRKHSRRVDLDNPVTPLDARTTYDQEEDREIT